MEKKLKDELQFELINAHTDLYSHKLNKRIEPSPADKLMATITKAYNALYRESMSDRVKRGIAERKKRLAREAKNNRNTDNSN